jgi:putative Mn2+ efflux pump MntP
VLVLADATPLPALVLIGLGFLVGIAGHIVRNNAAIVTGIGLIFIGSLLLPLAVYLTDR